MTIEPTNAIDMYLSDRTSELSESSIESYRDRLRSFSRWCDKNEIQDLSTLKGMDLHRYKVHLQEEVAHSTMVNRLHALRSLLKWAGRLDLISEDGLYEKVVVPKDDSSRERAMNEETMEDIISYLRRFEYATRSHVIIELLWHTTLRLGDFERSILKIIIPTLTTLTARISNSAIDRKPIPL